MQKFVDVEYDHKPNDIEIYKSGVDVITKCVETQKEDEQSGTTRTVWICDVERYSLLEYIYVQQSNYENALNVANAANDTANRAMEVAQLGGGEYAQAGRIMLGA